MTTVTTAADKAAALIEGVLDLPTPPMVFAQIVKVVDNPDTSACEVGSIIAEDPAMAAKVLRITNSAYYGLSGTVNSVKQAVVIIGLNGVRSLVVSTSVIDMFKDDRIGREFQDFFWRHSLVTAFGSRMLMRTINPGDPGINELAFSSGLLHDIGKMVMYLQDPDTCHRIQEECASQPSLELGAEREAFGCTHADVGAKITEKWSLPPQLSSAISYHHAPLDCDDPTHLTDVVHVADALAYHALSDGSIEVGAPGIVPEVFGRSGLKLEAAGEYLEMLKSEYLQAETFLNMARGAA